MATRSSRTRHIVRGIALGMAATLIVLALQLVEALDWAEALALDFRFRHLPTIEPNDEILHVDIDDASLEQIGRWPWPRRRLAQLVDTLNECGAGSVALDILLPHPQTPRYVKAGVTDLHQGDKRTLLDVADEPVLVLDDAELADTFRRSPNLYLAFHINIDEPEDREESDALIESLAARVTTRPALTPAEAAAETGRPIPEITQPLVVAGQTAFTRRARALLETHPDMPREQLTRAILGRIEGKDKNVETVHRIYLRQRGMTAIRRFALPEKDVAGASLRDGLAVPPLVTLAQTLAHTGFATVDPDDDGVVRSIPLLIRTDRGVFPQLALALAAETLAARHGGLRGIAAADGKVVITCKDGFTRAIPVNEDGDMLINWTRGEKRHHIPALSVQNVWKVRETIENNRLLYLRACATLSELTRWRFEGTVLDKVFAAYHGNAVTLRQVRQVRQEAMLFDPGNVPEIPAELLKERAELEKAIDRGCPGLIAFVDELTEGADENDIEDDPKARRILFCRKLIADINREQPLNQQHLEEMIAGLRARVAGKICLVGSAATGAADFTPTPLHERTPGVRVHANILNTILTGKFVTPHGDWLPALLVLAVGGLIAAVTATRGPIQSAVVLLTAIVAYAVLDAGVWKSTTYWMVAVGPIIAMATCFTVVTGYRQLTEQRAKRQITNTFKQYLSPTMVDRLVEDPAQAGLGGQRRQLSSLFSDLAGFTSLSERLGAERTVAILNRYLDRVGEIIQVRHGGTLSKYEGDGVFAFFGAPIPRADHPARALAAALDCQAFMSDLNRALKAEGLLPEDEQLAVRVGITTGEAFVGNMGSSQKIAYTAIGNSVNLAARLESANKFFGTKNLANGPAWAAGSDGLVGRPMGKVIVVGQTEPVEIWEPLARDGGADEQLHRLVADFARGVALYAAGDFEAARECFIAIIGRCDDAPARAYLGFCEAAIRNPPETVDFDGVIELTEK